MLINTLHPVKHDGKCTAAKSQRSTGSNPVQDTLLFYLKESFLFIFFIQSIIQYSSLSFK